MLLPCRGEQVGGDRDPPDRMEPAAFHKTAVPFAEIDVVAIDMLQPIMPVAFGEDEEQTLGLDGGADLERGGHSAWPQGDEALEHPVDGLETFMHREFIEGFEDGAFGLRATHRLLPPWRAPFRSRGASGLGAKTDRTVAKAMRVVEVERLGCRKLPEPARESWPIEMNRTGTEGDVVDMPFLT